MVKTESSAPKIRRKNLEAGAGYVLSLPGMLLILTFVIGPILFAFYLSFCDYNLFYPDQFRFVGVDNYIALLNDKIFHKALLNSFTYSIIVVPVQTSVALILAVIVNQKIKGEKFLRVAYYMPAVTSAVASAAIFMFLFNKNGIANLLLSRFGFKPVSWFSDPTFALPLTMIMAIWATVGTMMLIFLAALQDVPASVYEAASIDGVSKVKQFFKITVPLISEKSMFVIIIGIIGTLQMFDQAYIISDGKGGPLDSTMTVVLYLYNKAFKQNQMGYGAAIAFVLFAIIFILTIIQKTVIEKKGD